MIDFVCDDCADPGAEDGLDVDGHDRCRGGTWCDCQHGRRPTR